MTKPLVKKSEISFSARERQRHAADPSRSVWVSASAGTGKTRVLIDRVLRLLLPRENGAPGTRADKILCLTYTKAAAAEMTERLLSRVSRWAVISDKDLLLELEDLLGVSPTPDQHRSARRLFAKLVDGPQQVRLMTIHAFCQSILARFPLEAGLPAHFELIEGPAVDELLRQARREVLKRSGTDSVLRKSLQSVLAEVSEGTFAALMDRLFSEKRQLIYALRQNPPDIRRSVLSAQLGLSPDETSQTWNKEFLEFVCREKESLGYLASALSRTGATTIEQELSSGLHAWLEQAIDDEDTDFEGLTPVFFTKEGTRRKSGRHQGVRKKDSNVADLYEKIGDQVERFRSRKILMDTAQVNLDLLTVAEHVMTTYDAMKRARGLLDFDDIIRYTLRLLQAHSNESSATILSWVMYKLDGGIDHVLVDEAQDTNPEQWRIIRALTSSFFDDASAHRDRTLFVVGDQKQSIYSFQGADPVSFEQSLDAFSRARPTPGFFDRIPLNTSFRSGEAVLTLVDQVFDRDSLRDQIREQGPMTHVVHRVGQAARVELWPLEKTEPKTKDENTIGWSPALTVRSGDDVYDRLARRIALQMRDWLDSGEKLLSYNRPIEPRDILILVSKREPLLPRLMAALRRENIPVGGLDRLSLADELAVQDALAAARFALLPEDDLNLACLLKSPLIGMDDDDLIRLAPHRPGSLWQAVLAEKPDSYEARYLQSLIERAQGGRPHDFFSSVLFAPCPGDPQGSGLRAIKTRLSDSCADMIDEMMNIVLCADREGRTLVQILHQLTHENPEIKREGPSVNNVVRLMTVHGAKGLEAPIVILPDTIRSTSKGQGTPVIFWPEDTGMDLPLWSPRKDERSKELEDVATRAAQADLAEYNRLLYVALTRAQDRLIIAGAQKTENKTDPASWYFTVQNGFDRLASLPGFEETGPVDQRVLSYSVPQTLAPDRAPHQTSHEIETQPAARPEFLSRVLADEPAPRRPYRAEAASGGKDPLSPLAAQEDPMRFARGLVTHKLLQVLPNVPALKWQETARGYVSARSDIFDPGQQRGIVDDVMAVLNHPDFQAVFGPGSRAEVRVTGLLGDGRLVTGQIDRLLVTPDQILIVDYKTNPTPPRDESRVPMGYIHQMAVYTELIEAIYPGRPVRAGLIWTDGAHFMDLTGPVRRFRGLET